MRIEKDLKNTHMKLKEKQKHNPIKCLEPCNPCPKDAFPVFNRSIIFLVLISAIAFFF